MFYGESFANINFYNHIKIYTNFRKKKQKKNSVCVFCHTDTHTDPECTWPDLFIVDHGSLLLSCSVISNDHNMNKSQIQTAACHHQKWKETSDAKDKNKSNNMLR